LYDYIHDWWALVVADAVRPEGVGVAARLWPLLQARGCRLVWLATGEGAEVRRSIPEIEFDEDCVVASPLVADRGGAIARRYGLAAPGSTCIVGPDKRVHDRLTGGPFRERLRSLERCQAELMPRAAGGGR